jgi:hypothetical protein
MEAALAVQRTQLEQVSVPSNDNAANDLRYEKPDTVASDRRNDAVFGAKESDNVEEGEQDRPPRRETDK